MSETEISLQEILASFRVAYIKLDATSWTGRKDKKAKTSIKKMQVTDR